MSKFVDAPQDIRCKYDITLKDGSKAQCGRKAVLGGHCIQHHRIVCDEQRRADIARITAHILHPGL